MDIKELRIGNLVYDPNHYGGGLQILIDKIDLCHENKEWWDDLQPIPLTDEWLVRFGFKRKNVSSVFSDGSIAAHYDIDGFYVSVNFVFYGDELSIEIDYCCGEGNDSIVIRDGIKYVHQLQNLYYCLTGSELVLDSSRD